MIYENHIFAIVVRAIMQFDPEVFILVTSTTIFSCHFYTQILGSNHRWVIGYKLKSLSDSVFEPIVNKSSPQSLANKIDEVLAFV